MTYEEIFELKYLKGISTQELLRQYPDEASRVNEVALLDIPENVLRDMIQESDVLFRLIALKRKFKAIF
ncbi:MAG: hypothetical protein H6757_03420 [Candidatus Omnitrophica bacterium]|nr:hypothetical protein [Candidatus Omnitrophota bacterium]